jgi:hypothetical protein
MKKIHVTTVAILLGIAAVLALFAVTKTVSLGAGSRRAQDAVVQKRTQQLNAFEQSLRRQLTQTAAAPASTLVPRIVYHRPPPIVVTTHTQHGEGENEGRDD